MRTTVRAVAVGATALLVSLLALPAAAQEVEGGFDECIAAVEANLEDSAFIVPDIDDDPRPTLEQLAEQGLSPDEICAIYGVEVLDLVIEQPPVEEPPAEEPPADAPPQAAAADVAAVEVLGLQLARTGIDALVLALIGVALVGLGIVAVRRKGGAAEA